MLTNLSGKGIFKPGEKKTMKRELREANQSLYDEIQKLFYQFYQTLRELSANILKDERTPVVIPADEHTIPNLEKMTASFDDYRKRVQEGDEEFEAFLRNLKEVADKLEEKVRQYQSTRSCMIKEDADRSTNRIINNIQATMDEYTTFMEDDDNSPDVKNWITNCYNTYIIQSKNMNNIILQRNQNNRIAGMSGNCQLDILSMTRILMEAWSQYNRNSRRTQEDRGQLLAQTREVQLKPIYKDTDKLILNR
jgi:hypothetical protein